MGRAKEHLKQKFAALTDTDVLIIEGKKRNDNKIEVKCGKTRQEYTKLLMPFRADIEIMKHIKYFNFKVPVNNKVL
jgi:molybdopterin-guanine dinucleotide biosynthesis protein